MKKEFDVLVAGELNVDIILNNIQAFPEIGKEILANDMSVVLGSSSAILASNLSSLGTRVAFTGKTGKDVFSEIVFGSLNRRGVDCSRVIRDERYPTGATIVLNYGQDRANITFPGAMNHFGINDIDFEFLSRAKHLHFSSCFIQPEMKKSLPELFRMAKKAGLTTSMDPQWDPEEKWELPLEELMPYVDVFMPNIMELKYITGEKTLEDAVRKLSKLANILVVKNGEEGAWLWDGKSLSHQPAFKNEQVVDCIGAGDSFNAGFLSEYVKKSSLKKCMETGALMGAINTTQAGGTAAFEDYDTVRSVARERFNYNL
ncbi:MAG: carbohydrate kinase family protein [Bacteroidales bacterium]|nr:carbohydrate kinase family protein [Bacteroidales bacterium]